MMNENEKKNAAQAEETPETKEAPEAAAQQEESAAQEPAAQAEPAEADAKKDKKKDKKNKDKKNARPHKSLREELRSEKFKHGTMSTALTAIFIVAIILVNVIVGVLGERFPSINLDMTSDSDNSLSEEAIEVVDTVDEPTEILVMLAREDAEADSNYQKVVSISTRMAERNSNITVQFLDPDTEPALLSEYSGDGLTSGAVLVRTDKRYRVVTSSDLFPVGMNQSTYEYVQYTDVNGALASALSAVNADVMPVVAFDTGHSEMLDISSYKELLQNNNFDTVDVNIMTDEIPEGTQILVFPVPATDLSEEEITKINDYLNDTSVTRNRSVMFLYHPTQSEMPVLNSYLGEWGMSVTPSIVYEEESTNYMQSPSTLLATVSEDVDLEGESAYSYIVSPTTNPISILWDARNSVSVYPLLTSSETSYVYNVTEGSTLTEEGDPERDPDATGVQNLAAIGVKSVRGDDGDYFNASVLAIGSPFLFDGYFTGASTFGNGSYVTDLAKYVTGTTGSSTAVYSTPKQLVTNDIAMSGSQIMVLGLLVFTILIPLAFVISGIVVFIRRRHL